MEHHSFGTLLPEPRHAFLAEQPAAHQRPPVNVVYTTPIAVIEATSGPDGSHTIENGEKTA